MCFRPATTTMGARICKSCYMVCDDVTAVNCPSCGAPLDSSVAGEDSASQPAAPTSPSAPSVSGAPSAPSAPTGLGASED